MNGTPRWHAFQALRNTFVHLKAYPTTTFGSAALLSIPIAFSAAHQALRPGLLSLVLHESVAFVIGIWLSYAIVTATKQYAESTDPGVGRLLKGSLSGRLIIFAITQLLLIVLEALAVAVAALPLAMTFASLGLGSLSPDQLTGPGVARLLGAFMLSFVLGAALLLLIYLRYGLAPVVSALERRTPLPSFTRSRVLTMGKRLDFFVLLLITLGVGMAVALVLNGPGLVVSMGAATSAPRPEPGSVSDLMSLLGQQEPLAPAAAVVVAISTYLASAVGTAISAALLANFYLELSGREAAGIRSAELMSPEEGSGTISSETAR
jgi:hypothetical protein